MRYLTLTERQLECYYRAWCFSRDCGTNANGSLCYDFAKCRASLSKGYKCYLFLYSRAGLYYWTFIKKLFSVFKVFT